MHLLRDQPSHADHRVRVIALGNDDAGDDAAALIAGRTLAAEGMADVVLAGRPGVGLLDLLDPAVRVVLVDVVRTGGAAGAIVSMPLAEASARADAKQAVSSHGFGPAEALKLAESLGREIPRGVLIGIEGERFLPGAPLSSAVAGGIERLLDAVRAAIKAS